MMGFGLSAWMGSAALACGGFFCDNVGGGQPGVEQAGEVVIFGASEGEVTMHVGITYEGPADAFAWVLPLPSEPDIGVSPQTLFDLLQQRTRVFPTLQRSSSGCAENALETDADTDTDTDTDSDVDVDTDGGHHFGVDVVQPTAGGALRLGGGCGHSAPKILWIGFKPTPTTFRTASMRRLPPTSPPRHTFLR